MDQNGTARGVGVVAGVGWAAYLASSWTWCIGMFLPVLLVRDFGAAGLWAFVAFAVPNVVGAAALGWTVSSPASARRLLTEHWFMVRAFGAVTVAYQAFFAAWLGLCATSAVGGSGLGGLAWFAPLGAMLVVSVLPGMGGRGGGVESGGVAVRQRAFLVVSVLVTLLSLAVLAWAAVGHGVGGAGGVLGGGVGGEEVTNGGMSGGVRPSGELLPLVAICMLGFGLCPYLDATFLRARVEAAERSPLAFGLGFGWLFAAMIVGTLVLAPVLMPLARGLPPSLSGWSSAGSGPSWALVLGLHVCVQLLFTARVHSMELACDAATPDGRGLLRGLVAPAAVIVGGLLAGWAWVQGPSIEAIAGGGLRAGEVVYRLLLGAYGLVFPAYVLICVWPVRLPNGVRVTGPTRSRVVWLIAACALAMPAMWAGFIHLRMWWLLAGVAIVLAAAVGARRGVRRGAGF